jgi:hypothetical protein
VGRADLIAGINDSVYCFEFKIDGKGTVDSALQQIDDNGYLQPYFASGKRLYKVGVVFDPVSHTVSGWKAQPHSAEG